MANTLQNSLIPRIICSTISDSMKVVGGRQFDAVGKMKLIVVHSEISTDVLTV